MLIVITVFAALVLLVLAEFTVEAIRNWHGYKTGYAEGYRAGLDHGQAAASLDRSRRDQAAVDEALRLWGLGR